MHGADTKEQILNAAEELFARHGYAGTSMRAITKAAGVNLAAVNYHFGTKEKLLSVRRQLDPVDLLHGIREGQAALAALASPETATPEGPGRKTLDQFLAQLPKLWREGEARPTHRHCPVKSRHWRTRKDPFEEVWLDVLRWLQKEPDASAKVLFERLQRERPGQFPDGQLRTLQRRIKEWRRVMAKKLVYACMAGEEWSLEAEIIGANATVQA